MMLSATGEYWPRIQVPAEKWVGAEQTHETNIVKITASEAGLGALDYATALKHRWNVYEGKRHIIDALVC